MPCDSGRRRSDECDDPEEDVMEGNPLLPPVTAESAPFWEGAAQGELRVQRCTDTRRLFFPPRSISPWGTHRAPEWVGVSGLARIWSYVMVHPPLLPYFGERAPYNVVIVALDEDPRLRMVGNWVSEVGEWSRSPGGEEPSIGGRVKVVFDSPVEGVALPRWISDPDRLE